MTRLPILVLMVEDSEDDALLAAHELKRSGYDPVLERVETPEAMAASLERTAWDVVIADYSMPHFSGLAALRLVKGIRPEVPVIIVSGAIGEETAVSAMRAGANDYVMKGNLTRLGPAVQRELREVEDRRGRKRAEEALRKTSRELEGAQRELIQSEKLAALGRFSSGIAHEVKNPLGIVLGGVEFLDMKLADAEKDVKTAVGKIKEAALRAAGIIDEMLKFAKPSEPNMETLDANDVVREALSLFQYGVDSSHIHIVPAYAAHPLQIRADKNQIQQVILNLLLNAVEAMPGGGKVRVTIERDLLSGAGPASSCCAISVIDPGSGIAAEDMSKIFEPFFTTKREHKGTGLGLSVAKTIVDRHQGQLSIESKPGKGTTARILLPLVKSQRGKTHEQEQDTRD